jgi:hypothetical protein
MLARNKILLVISYLCARRIGGMLTDRDLFAEDEAWARANDLIAQDPKIGRMLAEAREKGRLEGIAAGKAEAIAEARAREIAAMQGAILHMGTILYPWLFEELRLNIKRIHSLDALKELIAIVSPPSDEAQVR